MNKIEKGTHNNHFNWILESDRHGDHPENNSAMIRELVKEHNKMVDHVKEIEAKLKLLDISSVVGRSEQLVCSCGSRLVKTTGGYHCGNAKCST